MAIDPLFRAQDGRDGGGGGPGEDGGGEARGGGGARPDADK